MTRDFYRRTNHQRGVMTRLPRPTGKEIIIALRSADFEVVRVSEFR